MEWGLKLERTEARLVEALRGLVADPQSVAEKLHERLFDRNIFLVEESSDDLAGQCRQACHMEQSMSFLSDQLDKQEGAGSEIADAAVMAWKYLDELSDLLRAKIDDPAFELWDEPGQKYGVGT